MLSECAFPPICLLWVLEPVGPFACVCLPVGPGPGAQTMTANHRCELRRNNQPGKFAMGDGLGQPPLCCRFSPGTSNLLPSCSPLAPCKLGWAVHRCSLEPWGYTPPGMHPCWAKNRPWAGSLPKAPSDPSWYSHPADMMGCLFKIRWQVPPALCLSDSVYSGETNCAVL